MPDFAPNGNRTLRTGFHSLPGGGQLYYAVADPQNGPPLFTVLTVPGLGEPVAKKDFELGDAVATAGARHIIFDMRGQGQSSRFLDGALRQRAYVPSFRTYIDDLHSFFEKTVKENVAGKLIVNGHSTGGLVLLSWLAAKNPSGIAAVIVTAPALALSVPPQNLPVIGSVPIPRSVAFAIAAAFAACGRGKEYAWGQHDFAPDFEDRRLTHDRARFDWLSGYFRRHPDQTTGGATWRWSYETLKQGYALRLSGALGRIAAPTLVLLAGEDRVVPTGKIADWAQSIPNRKIVTVAGAYHEVTNEDEPYRNAALSAFMEFARTHAL